MLHSNWAQGLSAHAAREENLPRKGRYRSPLSSFFDHGRGKIECLFPFKILARPAIQSLLTANLNNLLITRGSGRGHSVNTSKPSRFVTPGGGPSGVVSRAEPHHMLRSDRPQPGSLEKTSRGRKTSGSVLASRRIPGAREGGSKDLREEIGSASHSKGVPISSQTPPNRGSQASPGTAASSLDESSESPEVTE